jgi:hypothetical protein
MITTIPILYLRDARDTTAFKLETESGAMCWNGHGPWWPLSRHLG